MGGALGLVSRRTRRGRLMEEILCHAAAATPSLRGASGSRWGGTSRRHARSHASAGGGRGPPPARPPAAHCALSQTDKAARWRVATITLSNWVVGMRRAQLRGLPTPPPPQRRGFRGIAHRGSTTGARASAIPLASRGASSFTSRPRRAALSDGVVRSSCAFLQWEAPAAPIGARPCAAPPPCRFLNTRPRLSRPGNEEDLLAGGCGRCAMRTPGAARVCDRPLAGRVAALPAAAEGDCCCADRVAGAGPALVDAILQKLCSRPREAPTCELFFSLAAGPQGRPHARRWARDELLRPHVPGRQGACDVKRPREPGRLCCPAAPLRPPRRPRLAAVVARRPWRPSACWRRRGGAGGRRRR